MRSLVGAALVAMLAGAAQAAGTYRATELVPPPGYARARIQAIGPNGVMLGIAETKAGGPDNVFWEPGGRVTSLGGYHTLAQRTNVMGFNAKGDVVGFYSGKGQYEYIGYIASADGRLVEVAHPQGDGDTSLRAINSSGTAVGHAGRQRDSFVFIRSASGTITRVTIPGGQAVYAGGITEDGTVVGTYTAASSGVRGFLRRPDGELTTFDPPAGATGLTITSINEAGQIAGSYEGKAAKSFPFVRERDGTYVTIKPPHGQDGQVTALGPGGEIAGTYTGADRYGRSFVARPGPAAAARR